MMLSEAGICCKNLFVSIIFSYLYTCDKDTTLSIGHVELLCILYNYNYMSTDSNIVCSYMLYCTFVQK